VYFLIIWSLTKWLKKRDEAYTTNINASVIPEKARKCPCLNRRQPTDCTAITIERLFTVSCKVTSRQNAQWLYDLNKFSVAQIDIASLCRWRWITALWRPQVTTWCADASAILWVMSFRHQMSLMAVFTIFLFSKVKI
jgi:hypothetical protein